MKADAPTSRVHSAKKPRLRYLDLSFEGRETAKGTDGDNGKLSHGGYKGSKKHPIGIYSFDKGRDYQRQIREDLDKMLEGDVLEVHGSPSWAIEAHRQPTHSGESPLLANKFLSASKHESVNGVGRWAKDMMRPNRCSAPPVQNGVLYYRPNRTHQYLTATELKDASEADDVLKYGRPTRTTLLRARQRAGSASSNAYEIRRQLVQRMDEIRHGCVFSNPKEFLQQQHTDIDGQSFHSFVTGARYNRAHCLDSKSLTQYGVYMPRNNPLGCFVVGQKDILDTTSAPPDSPRSDVDEGSTPLVAPKRPTTAPGYGRKRGIPVPPTPRQAWGDASSSVHITNGDDKAKHVVEEIMIWGPGLNVKGMRLPLNMNREGPVRSESKLPSVHGTSLSKLRRQVKENADDNSDANQPPPSPVPTSARGDNSLPVVKPEGDADRKSDPDQPKQQPEPQKLKPVLIDRSVNVPSVSGGGSVAVQDDSAKQTEAQNEAGEEEEETEQKPADDKPAEEEKEEKEETAEPEEKTEEEGNAGTEEGAEAVSTMEGAQKEPEATEPIADASDSAQKDAVQEEEATPEDDATKAEGDNDSAEPAADQSAKEETGHVEEPTTGDAASKEQTNGDTVKFFLTEEGADAASKPTDAEETVAISNQRVIGDDVEPFQVETHQNPEVAEDDKMSTSSKGSKGKSKDKRTVTFSDENVKDTKNDDVNETDVVVENTDVTKTDINESEKVPGNETEAEDTELEDNDLGEGQTEPLKVIVTHIDRSSADGSPVPESEGGVNGGNDPTSNNNPSKDERL